jgi:hypothetical protein
MIRKRHYAGNVRRCYSSRNPKENSRPKPSYVLLPSVCVKVADRYLESITYQLGGWHILVWHTSQPETIEYRGWTSWLPSDIGKLNCS